MPYTPFEIRRIPAPVNQMVKREIKRLHIYLLRITSFIFGADSKRRDERCRPGTSTGPCRSAGTEPDLNSPDDNAMLRNHPALFGRVLGSLNGVQAVCGKEFFIYIYKFQDHALDLFSAKRCNVKRSSPHPDRRVERSQKTGFDVLRVTLNLARGNIEPNVSA